MLITAAILAILSIPLLILGLRGRQVDDHPVCRKCKFDLVGVFPETKVCPECGGDQAETAPRTGNRRKRWRIVLIGCAAIVVATSLVGFDVRRVVNEHGWVRLQPTFWLGRKVLSNDLATLGTSADELLRRLDEEELSASKIRSAINGVLDRQEDADVDWLPAWGQFVEFARQRGAVSDEQWGRYAHGVFFKATLLPRSPVRLGDAVPFKVDLELRCSFTLLFPAKILVMPASVNGVPAQNDGEGSRSDSWNVLHPGSRQFGYESVGMAFPISMSMDIYEHDPLIQSSGRVVWSRAMTLGQGTQGVQVHAYLFENPDFPERMQRQFDLVPEKALAMRTFELDANFMVVDADTSTIDLVTSPNTAPSITSMNTLVGEWPNGRWRCQGQLNVPVFVTGIAFDVFWRAGDREWPLGTIRRSSGGRGARFLGYFRLLEGFDPVEHPTVDIVLRPSPAVARRTPDMNEIWGEEIIIKDVLIEGPDLP